MSRLSLFMVSRLLKRMVLVAIAVEALNLSASAQNDPYVSGGAGFITSTKGGNTSYIPVIAPAFVAPIGDRLLVESRATILESFFPRGGNQSGYDHEHFADLSYLQADILASRYTTIVGGEFLTPFGTYNERLSPIWVSNFSEAPLIFSLGTMSTASSVGGMLRGSAASAEQFNITYTAFFSAASTNEQFSAQRATGGQVSVYFPKIQLEAGASYDRRLQDTHENFSGVHVWWEPAGSNLRLRSEYARGAHSLGYWIEADYRLAHFGGAESVIGRIEPVFRMQQTFRSAPDPSDGLPVANTTQPDFALDYRLPHEIRINTSYSREFSSSGNRNIWQTGVVYRFLIPAWRVR